jgi:hypothetical protein
VFYCGLGVLHVVWARMTLAFFTEKVYEAILNIKSEFGLLSFSREYDDESQIDFFYDGYGVAITCIDSNGQYVLRGVSAIIVSGEWRTVRFSFALPLGENINDWCVATIRAIIKLIEVDKLISIIEK